MLPDTSAIGKITTVDIFAVIINDFIAFGILPL